MANLIDEIFDKQAVVDQLTEIQGIINDGMQKIVDSAPKLKTPIDYVTALQALNEADAKSTEVTKLKTKALDDLAKAYVQADKAMDASINLENEEYQEVTKLTSEYKERAKEQKQLLELERVRQQTMKNSAQLLSQQAQSEGELRRQTAELIKASQSLRVTNAEENKVRQALIEKINANKVAIKDMTNEVSKQKDNVGNYASAWDAVIQGQMTVKGAMAETRNSLAQLEALVASGVTLTAEQSIRYAELNATMGKLTDIQGDMSARAKALANDYLGLNTALEGLKFGASSLSAVQSATALLGVEDEKLVATIQKVQAAQAFANSVNEIAKSLNKDSALVQGLRVVKERLLTTALGEQTKAQLALNAAKLGMVGIVAGVVAGLGVWIAKMASAKNQVADLNKELNKQSTESVAPLIVKVNQLKNEYNALGDDLGAKKKYFEEHKDEIKGINENLDTQEKFENAIINNTAQFVEAQINRAKAEAARTMITETIKEQLTAQMEYERRYIKDQKTFWEGIVDWYNGAKLGAENYAEMAKTLYEQEQKQYDKQITDLMKMADNFSKLSDEMMKALGLEGNRINTLNEERQSVEDELNTEEKLYLMRKKVREELDKQSLPTIARFSVKVKDNVDVAELLSNRYEKASIILSTKYLKALQNAESEEEKKQITAQYNVDTTELQIAQYEALNKLLPENSKEYLKNAEAIEKLKVQLLGYKDTLNSVSSDEAKIQNERKKAYDTMVKNVGEAFNSMMGFVQAQKDADEDWYNSQKWWIEDHIKDEEERERRLKELDDEKVKRDRETAKKEAQIKRRQAIFQNAVDAAAAMSKAVASVGELLATSAGGDTYTAVARYIAAIAAGVSAVTTIATLISRLVQIPQFAEGGVAEADKPFIAGEKGREIGFGQRTGKVYDFAKPMIFKANEPIRIHNAKETKQIVNNEYNKDVTIHNTLDVKVIDNTRVERFFKL